jgi:hypothetical protein
MDEEDKTARFEQQSLTFFGTKDKAEAFWSLERTEDKLQAIWALPVAQDLLKKNSIRVHEKSLGNGFQIAILLMRRVDVHSACAVGWVNIGTGKKSNVCPFSFYEYNKTIQY